MGSKVIALKYRPQTFQEVVGQEPVIRLLKNAIQTQQLPHALIFSGIRGIGKTTLARIVAKVLNCENPKDGDACGKCSSCLGVQDNSHLDIIEIDAASHTGVDNIRELIESSQYKAIRGQVKVFIIDEVHMLSKSAFNALLKTLEEPYDHVYYILATTEIHKVPPTILSRCMRCSLSAFSSLEIRNYMEKILKAENIGFESDALDDIVYSSSGSMRDALTFLNQIIVLSDTGTIKTEDVKSLINIVAEDNILIVLDLLFQGEVKDALIKARSLIQNHNDPVVFMQQVMDAVYALCCEKQSIKTSLENEVIVAKVMKHITLSQLFQIWQILHKGYQELLHSPLKMQTLEMIFMRICFVKDVLTETSEIKKKLQ